MAELSALDAVDVSDDEAELLDVELAADEELGWVDDDWADEEDWANAPVASMAESATPARRSRVMIGRSPFGYRTADAV